MLLPTELLLQVLHYADYKTLVLAMLAGRRFLLLADKLAEKLACRRSFIVSFKTTYIEYVDMTTSARHRLQYDHGNQASLAATCREVGVAVGSHAVYGVTFYDNMWSMPGVDVIFEEAPSLKYAVVLNLYTARSSNNVGDSDVFMRHFVGINFLRLDDDVFRQFSWSFLRQDSARELERITVLDVHSTEARIMDCSIEELVRNCVTLPHLLGSQALVLDFPMNNFSGSFGRRIIEMFKESGRELTFWMKALQDGDELVLDESEYTVEVDGNATRYASKNSGLVVEIEGRSVTIQSTTRVPRKK